MTDNLRLLLFFVCVLVAPALTAQNKPRKAVFILVDGIPADVIERVSTPSLQSIAQVGKNMRAHVGGEKGTYSETPTISAVGYNSMLTGTWVNKHNVWDNDIKAPDYHYPTIFRLFKNQYPSKKTAIFSSWTDNRTKLIGEGLSEMGSIQLDYRFDGYELDTIRFPHDQQGDFMHRIDEKVTEATVATIREQAPDLSWVYLEYTDDMGHTYGDSQQFYNAVEKMDTQIGRIWQAVQFRQQQFKEDWLVMITTDHGRDEQTGRGHGGQSKRQRSTWIVTNYPQLNQYTCNFDPAIVDIMPTLANFMNISVPTEVNREIDGVSLIGNLSLVKPEINYIQGYLDVTWKVIGPKGKVKIWVATTNHFKSGGKDAYTLAKEVSLESEHALIDVRNQPSTFYKVVLEGPFNTVNQWVMLKE